MFLLRNNEFGVFFAFSKFWSVSCLCDGSDLRRMQRHTHFDYVNRDHADPA